MEIRQEQQQRAGGREDGTERNASKEKRPRDRKIFMGHLGSISFSFSSFLVATNIYPIKKHSPSPPRGILLKTLPIMTIQIFAEQ